jgi:hypothetical protein
MHLIVAAKPTDKYVATSYTKPNVYYRSYFKNTKMAVHDTIK